MKTTEEQIEDIKQHGYELNFGQVFEQTFENYKKIALLGGALLLVLFIIFMVLMGGLLVSVGIFSSISDGLTGFGEQMKGFTTVSIFIKLLMAVATAILIAPIGAGILKIAHHAETYKDYNFSTAFDYYKTPALKEIFISALIISLFSQSIETFCGMMPVYLGETPANILLFSILSFIINIIIALFTFQMLPLIVFGNLKAGAAIKGSFILITQNFWVILGLMLIVGICALLGILGICIGVFFTYPIMYALQYIIYRNAIEIGDKDEMDEIGLGEDSRF